MGRTTTIVLVALTLVCLGLLNFRTIDGAEPVEQTASADQIWGELRQLKGRAVTSQSAIILNAATLKRYLFRSPRNYSAIVHFTINDPRCQACKLVDPVWEEAATAWTAGRDTKNVFFFSYSTGAVSDPLTTRLGVPNVPAIVHFGPSEKTEARLTEQDDIYKLTMQSLKSSMILEWMTSRTGLRIYPYVNPWPRIIFSILAASLLAVITTLFIKFIPLLFSNWRDPMIWYAVVLVPFFATIAGVVWDAIRQPMMFSQNPQTGKIMFIAPTSQYQFIIEGILISLITLAIGILIVAITVNLEEFSAWKQRLFFYPTFSLLFFLMWLLHDFFCLKHKYYPFAWGQHLNHLFGLV